MSKTNSAVHIARVPRMLVGFWHHDEAQDYLNAVLACDVVASRDGRIVRVVRDFGRGDEIARNLSNGATIYYE